MRTDELTLQYARLLHEYGSATAAPPIAFLRQHRDDVLLQRRAALLLRLWALGRKTGA